MKVLFLVMMWLPGLSEPVTQQGEMRNLQECTESVQNFITDFHYHELQGKVLAGCVINTTPQEEAK